MVVKVVKSYSWVQACKASTTVSAWQSCTMADVSVNVSQVTQDGMGLGDDGGPGGDGEGLGGVGVGEGLAAGGLGDGLGAPGWGLLALVNCGTRKVMDVVVGLHVSAEPAAIVTSSMLVPWYGANKEQSTWSL